MNKPFFRCFLAVMAYCSILVTFPGNSFALQGIAPSGPIGGTDINQALIPPPGLYGAVVAGVLDFNGWVLDDGTEIDAGNSATIIAIGLAYVWDFKLFGGSVLTSISTGYQDQEWTIGGSEVDPFSGYIDIYSDIFYWGRFFPSNAFLKQPKGSMVPYGLAVAGGLGITFPTGTYDSDEPNSVGSNVYTISPSVSLTYTAPSLLGKTLGDATQFSFRTFYNTYTDQEDRNYRNGDIVNTDYSITQIKNNWQYGIDGTYYVQVTDDKFINGNSGVSNRTEMFSVGGVLGYNFAIHKQPFFTKFKANFFVDGKNTADSNIAFLTIGTKF